MTKTFSKTIGIKENISQLTQVLNPIANGTTRVLFGYLADIFSFKALFVWLNVTEIGVALSMKYFSTQSSIIYLIFNLLTNTFSACNFSVFPTYMAKRYGPSRSIKLYGVVFSSFGLSSFIGALASLPIETEDGYGIIFNVGALLAFLSLLMVISLKNIKKAERVSINK